MKAINISLSSPHRVCGENLEKQIDQFQASEFFFKDSVPLPDVVVYEMAQNNPEIREKIQESIIRNDVASMSDKTDEEILSSMRSKYEDRYSMMQRLVNKELELKQLELDKEQKQKESAE